MGKKTTLKALESIGSTLEKVGNIDVLKSENTPESISVTSKEVETFLDGVALGIACAASIAKSKSFGKKAIEHPGLFIKSFLSTYLDSKIQDSKEQA